MAIEVRIHREFDDFKLDVQFQSESRRIGILGASGCGKSLTLKSIAGIERPETGKIESAGKVFFDSAKKNMDAAAGAKCRLLVSELRTFPDDNCGKEYWDCTSLWKKGKRKKSAGHD